MARHAYEQQESVSVLIDYEQLRQESEEEQESERELIWQENPLSGRSVLFAIGYLLVNLAFAFWDTLCLFGQWSRESIVARTGARPHMGAEEGVVSLLGFAAVFSITVLFALFAILG